MTAKLGLLSVASAAVGQTPTLGEVLDHDPLGLLDRGVWDPVNCRLFPKTVALLKESKTPCVEAFFAKMPAGTSIGAHSDGCNFHLTSHLGDDVPEGLGAAHGARADFSIF